MASIGEFPDLVRATFVNEETNENGIYNIRFFIRGKPWIVTIDDHLLFYDTDPASLVFSSTSKDNTAIWGALLEKAWAKVKGNYLISEGGMTANGIRALTGVPVFDYYSAEFGADSASQDQMWELLVEAEANNYIMAAGTAGAGDDSWTNDCGVAMSHAYSLIGAFTMTDASNTEHRCLLIRNPWGSNGYSWTWS
jgi:calpain